MLRCPTPSFHFFDLSDVLMFWFIEKFSINPNTRDIFGKRSGDINLVIKVHFSLVTLNYASNKSIKVIMIYQHPPPPPKKKKWKSCKVENRIESMFLLLFGT